MDGSRGTSAQAIGPEPGRPSLVSAIGGQRLASPCSVAAATGRRVCGKRGVCDQPLVRRNVIDHPWFTQLSCATGRPAAGRRVRAVARARARFGMRHAPRVPRSGPGARPVVGGANGDLSRRNDSWILIWAVPACREPDQSRMRMALGKGSRHSLAAPSLSPTPLPGGLISSRPSSRALFSPRAYAVLSVLAQPVWRRGINQTGSPRRCRTIPPPSSAISS